MLQDRLGLAESAGLIPTVVDGQALAAGSVVGDASALEAQRQADPSLDHLSAIEDLFDDQLQAADLVLVSRAAVLVEGSAPSNTACVLVSAVFR